PIWQRRKGEEHVAVPPLEARLLKHSGEAFGHRAEREVQSSALVHPPTLVRGVRGCAAEPFSATEARRRDEYRDSCSDQRDDCGNGERDRESVDRGDVRPGARVW